MYLDLVQLYMYRYSSCMHRTSRARVLLVVTIYYCNCCWAREKSHHGVRGGSAGPLLAESRCPRGAAAAGALAGAIWGVAAAMFYSCRYAP
jgi:hypothetical protein